MHTELIGLLSVRSKLCLVTENEPTCNSTKLFYEMKLNSQINCVTDSQVESLVLHFVFFYLTFIKTATKWFFQG